MAHRPLVALLVAALVLFAGCSVVSPLDSGAPEKEAVVENVESADSVVSTENITVTRFEGTGEREYEWGYTKTRTTIADFGDEELHSVTERDLRDWNGREVSESESWYKDGTFYLLYAENRSAEAELYTDTSAWDEVSIHPIDAPALLTAIDTEPERVDGTYVYAATPDGQEEREALLDTLVGAGEFELNKHDTEHVESVSAEVGVEDGYITYATLELDAETSTSGRTTISVHVEYEEYDEPVEIEVPDDVREDAA